MDWLKQFKEISSDALTLTKAQSITRLLLSEEYTGARLIGCRKKEDGCELLHIRVEVGLGQAKLSNNINISEEVAVVVTTKDCPPAAVPLRTDFPDVPHLHTAPKGTPRSLCLYDEPWQELKRSWTALSFLERIRWWLRETAYGKLHDDLQPLDPVLLGGGGMSSNYS